MRRRWVLVSSLAAGLGQAAPTASSAPGAPSASARPIRMPRPPYATQEPSPFQRELLQLALRKAGWPDELELLPPQTWLRQVRELQSGHADVSPLPALQTEVYGRYGLLRVDVPLRQGLLGVRRLVVRAERARALAAVRNLDTLKTRFVMGYGADWGDLPEMRRLGFRLRTATNLPGLYELLREGQVDYLSRGLNEVDGERALIDAVPGELVVLKEPVLSYPLDDCFFVAPSREDLHQAVAKGLERAGRDGSHLALLQHHYGHLLEQLVGARVLRVPHYPSPPGLRPEQLEAWRRAVPGASP